MAEQFKVNVAQHRGGYTIDNEDGTKEFAFVADREHARIFADTGNRIEWLEKALREIEEQLASHPDANVGNSKVHYCLCKARVGLRGDR